MVTDAFEKQVLFDLSVCNKEYIMYNKKGPIGVMGALSRNTFWG